MASLIQNNSQKTMGKYLKILQNCVKVQGEKVVECDDKKLKKVGVNESRKLMSSGRCAFGNYSNYLHFRLRFSGSFLSLKHFQGKRENIKGLMRS